MKDEAALAIEYNFYLAIHHIERLLHIGMDMGYGSLAFLERGLDPVHLQQGGHGDRHIDRSGELALEMRVVAAVAGDGAAAFALEFSGFFQKRVHSARVIVEELLDLHFGAQVTHREVIRPGVADIAGHLGEPGRWGDDAERITA